MLTTGATTPNPFQVLPNTTNFPDLVGEFPKSSGKVTVTSTPGRVTYFDGFTRVADPGRAGVTTTQNLQAANTQFAIADAQGRIVLANPAAGKLGTLGQNWIEGPGVIGLDANLLKRVRISETKEFEIRMVAINVLNHANWPNPTVDINSPNFGIIALPGAPGTTGGQNPRSAGNRMFTFQARLNF
jgi:hypothetical protein